MKFDSEMVAIRVVAGPHFGNGHISYSFRIANIRNLAIFDPPARLLTENISVLLSRA
jgi:hypothetical protein